MAGKYFKRLETHTPLKALPSATLHSAPVRTFNDSDKQRLDTALTVGQLSAPPPEAVTLQADQRTDNKVILLSALPLPYRWERTWYAMMSLPAIIPANFLKTEKQTCFWEKFLKVINLLSFGEAPPDDKNRDAWCIITKILKLPYIY